MSENVSLQVEPKQTQVAAPATVAPATVAPTAGHVSVPLVMLQNIKSILEICGDRGSFKTAEMYGIGLTYNELSKYISDTEVKSV